MRWERRLFGALGAGLEGLRPVAAGARERLRRARARVASRLELDELEERAQLIEERERLHGPDPFGMEPKVARRAAMFAAFLHRAWFRGQVFGIDQLPQGRVLLVANHSGQLPFDGVVIAAALLLDANPPRVLRALVERWTQTLPLISELLPRIGQVVGDAKTAQKLLEREEALLVFPEGARAIAKGYERRYQLEPFTHGFMRLAIRTQTPVVPLAVVGAEEQYVSFGNWEAAARSLRMPAFPLVPQWLVPLGLVPLPTRYRLHFGAPMLVGGDAEDAAHVAAEVARVEQEVARLLALGLEQRPAVFL